MATPASQLIRDQNVNFVCDGTAFGMNTNKAHTKGRLGTRRVLGDISNSTKPTALQASKKTNSNSIISIGADDPKTKFSTGGQVSSSKAKKQVGGRKVLGDLTNSSKLSVQQGPKKGYGEKISVVDPVDEGFLHNHQECLKEQRRKVIDMVSFHKEVGLGNVSSMPFLLTPHAYPPSLQPKALLETPLKIEEVPMSPLSLMSSTPHVCKLPMSPISSPCMDWDWIEEEDANFTIKADYS